MTTTLTNDFHNTEIRVRAAAGDVLSPSQVARIRRALCGMADCVCSGHTGVRGAQPDGISVEVEYGYRPGEDKYRLIELSNAYR